MNKCHWHNLFLPVVGLLCICLTLSSCEPLRKKFIRQKKKGVAEDSNFIPVLEPQEYPNPLDNPFENYKGHYDLVKAWYKDAWDAAEQKTDDKRKRSILNQMYSHLTEMQALVLPEQQAQFGKLLDLLKYYNSSLSEPEAMRNKSRILSDLRAFDRLLRQWRADKIQASLVKKP